MTRKFLDSVYDLGDARETRDLYDEWAASYEAEVAENGYETPGRVAEALRAQVTTPSVAILDYGCGTGLSGLALRRAGFETIDGMDPSTEMLDGARAKNVYRALITLDLDDPTPLAPGTYQVICAIGVIGQGAAPPETLDLLMKALPKAGLLALSYNDHTLNDPTYISRLNEWLESGAARLLSRDYGPHLTALNMKSDVYIIEKS